MANDLLIMGLGYVGLPLALEATRAGLAVCGVDVQAAVVQGLRAGRSHVDDISDADVRLMVDRGFRVEQDVDSAGPAEASVICVPTPLSDEGGPDLRAVISAASALGPNVRPGDLVVLESTTFPGTTEDIVRPVLESGSGLTAGEGFHLAFSPERIDPGNPAWGLKNTPKVVGGLTPACTEASAKFYGRIVDAVVRARSCREAETAKLLENTYRHINIALVNEMARFCHELQIDIWDVIRLARTKPFGFQAFYPGPGVGGHCIPIDPNYLSHAVRTRLGYPFRFVELAQEINATMPAYVVHRAQNILNHDRLAMNGAKILLLGVTYKADIADDRESPAVQVAQHLATLGAQVSYHDPKVEAWLGGRYPRVSDCATAAAEADLVVLLQAHAEYEPDLLATTARRFFDTRGVTTVQRAHRL